VIHDQHLKAIFGSDNYIALRVFPAPLHNPLVVRYADDFVLGFQHRDEAESFLKHLWERMAEYGLELHAEKTRLIEFGRFAAEDRKRDGAGKPETFKFLGFTHICGTIWKSGKYTVHRRTVGKRMTAKLKNIAAALHKRRHDPIRKTGD
jgi:hypothetical protein